MEQRSSALHNIVISQSVVEVQYLCFCPDTHRQSSLSSSQLSSIQQLSDHRVSCGCQSIQSQCLNVLVTLLMVSPDLTEYFPQNQESIITSCNTLLKNSSYERSQVYSHIRSVHVEQIFFMIITGSSYCNYWYHKKDNKSLGMHVHI